MMHNNTTPKRKKKRYRIRVGRLILVLLVFFAMVAGVFFLINAISCGPKAAVEERPPQPTPEPIVYVEGFLRGEAGVMIPAYEYVDHEDGTTTHEQCAQFVRGTMVTYDQKEVADAQGLVLVQIDGQEYRVMRDAIVTDPGDIIAEETLYMRTAQNLILDVETEELGILIKKGTELCVIGYDELDEEGNVHMYQVSFDVVTEKDEEGNAVASESYEGYVRPWYLADTVEEAKANYDEDGMYLIHAERADRYGGGDAASLDYFPRENASFEDNVMPDECRTLYLNCYGDILNNVDDYIALADECGINAFVVDISDGGAIAYQSPLMKEVTPTCYENANYTVEEYAAAIKKLQDAGYYVIGRITTFNDTGFVIDNPECGILGKDGNPLKLQGSYWPSAYNRATWVYKVDLAQEAVELFGFNEIQFDYVRFPDGTYTHEKNGTIDYQNDYDETKAQAIQRFLMYACDRLHESGVYVSADVFGETSNDYVAAYGQYWPAISNVVDIISAMPYPDHYGEWGGYKPWEHPYDTLAIWGSGAAKRQTEIPTPAGVRTWIQAYDAIHEPYTVYGPDNVGAQIRAIRDAGFTDGYMTWNAASNIWKYESLQSAFNL